MKTLKEEAREFVENYRRTHPDMIDTPKVVVPAVLSKRSQEVKEWLDSIGFPSKAFLEKLNQK